MLQGWTLTNNNGSPIKKKDRDEDSVSEIGSDIHIIEHGDLIDSPTKTSKESASGSETESVKSVRSAVSSSTESVKKQLKKVKNFINTQSTVAVEKTIAHYATAKAKTTETVCKAKTVASENFNKCVAEAKNLPNEFRNLPKERKQKGAIAVFLIATIFYILHREISIYILENKVDSGVKTNVILNDRVKRYASSKNSGSNISAIKKIDLANWKKTVKSIKSKQAKSSIFPSWVESFSLRNKSSIQDFSKKIEKREKSAKFTNATKKSSFFPKIDLSKFRSAFKSQVPKRNLPTMHLNNYSWSVASSLKPKLSVSNFSTTRAMKRIKQKGFKKFEKTLSANAKKMFTTFNSKNLFGKKTLEEKKETKVTASNYYKVLKRSNKENYAKEIQNNFESVIAAKKPSAPKYSFYKSSLKMSDLNKKKSTETKKINNLLNFQHFYTPKKDTTSAKNPASVFQNEKRTLMPEFLSPTNALRTPRYFSRVNAEKKAKKLINFDLNGAKSYVNSNGKYMASTPAYKKMPVRNLQAAKAFANGFNQPKTTKDFRLGAQKKAYANESTLTDMLNKIKKGEFPYNNMFNFSAKKNFSTKFSHKVTNEKFDLKKYSKKYANKYSAKKNAFEKFASPKYNILDELKEIENKTYGPKFENYGPIAAAYGPKVAKNGPLNVTYGPKKVKFGPYKKLISKKTLPTRNLQQAKSFAAGFTSFNGFSKNNVFPVKKAFNKKELPTRNLRLAKKFSADFDKVFSKKMLPGQTLAFMPAPKSVFIHPKTRSPVLCKECTLGKHTDKLMSIRQSLSVLNMRKSEKLAFPQLLPTRQPFRSSSQPKMLPTRASRINSKISLTNFGEVAAFPKKKLATRQPLNKLGKYNEEMEFVPLNYSVADELGKKVSSTPKKTSVFKTGSFKIPTFKTSSLFKSLNNMRSKNAKSHSNTASKKYDFSAMSSYLNKNFNLFPRNITVNKESWFPKIEKNPGVFTNRNFGNYKAGMFEKTTPVRASTKPSAMFNFESHPLFADFKPNYSHSVREAKPFKSALSIYRDSLLNAGKGSKFNALKTPAAATVPDFGIKKFMSRSAQKLNEYLRGAFGAKDLSAERENKRFALMKLKTEKKDSFEKLSQKIEDLKLSMRALPRKHVLSQKFSAWNKDETSKFGKSPIKNDEFNYAAFKKSNTFNKDFFKFPKTLKPKKFSMDLFAAKNSTLASIFQDLVKKVKKSAVKPTVTAIKPASSNSTNNFSLKLAALKAKAAVASSKLSKLLNLRSKSKFSFTPKTAPKKQDHEIYDFYSFGNSTWMKSFNSEKAAESKTAFSKSLTTRPSAIDVLKAAYAKLEKQNNFAEDIKITPRVSKPYKIVYDQTEARGVFKRYQAAKVVGEKKSEKSATEKLWNPPRFWNNRRKALWDDL